jgi:hypothetical protein
MEEGDPLASQTRLPQFGHGASPDGKEKSIEEIAPQSAHSLGSPSGVRDGLVTAFSTLDMPSV